MALACNRQTSQTETSSQRRTLTNRIYGVNNATSVALLVVHQTAIHVVAFLLSSSQLPLIGSRHLTYGATNATLEALQVACLTAILVEPN
jgi:hypothetical protein